MSYKLSEIEEELDKRAKELGILSLPLRSVLTNIFGILDALCYGNRLKGGTPRRQAGQALVSRLSYLLPILLTKCDVESLGDGVLDAMKAFTLQDFAELQFLLQYGHYCELMPAIHRKWYLVHEVANRSYSINHLSTDIARFDWRDIVLSETAMPQEPEIDVAKYYDATYQLADTAPNIDMGLFVSVIYSIKNEYIAGEREFLGISEEGFFNATGVAFETFRQFRAAWAAYSICCQLIAEMLFATTRFVPESEKERLVAEAWEWIMPLIDASFIDSLICSIARLQGEEYGKLMRFFAVDAKARTAPQAGDGFLPPIIKFGDGYLFSPQIVRTVMSTRNLLYVKNKLAPDSFSRSIANEMEPALIAAAVKIFQQIPQLVVVPNVCWERGEIDILVFNPDENAALQIQAKAAIPPEGARMTRAMETRIAEAFSQLERLHQENSTTIDELISQAVKRKVSAVTVCDAILTSSCFGTSTVWQRMKGMAALNLPLLAAVIGEIRSGNEQEPVARLAAMSYEILDRWCNDLSPGWAFEKLTIDDVTLEVPVLELDPKYLRDIRNVFQQALDA
ncbi:hypothetical protein VX159_06915 [Dechloromonas sp. ZY10]|uniref:hypothetical protein n=1 Tax=Dechloromonas aquae TaxID=2664436 RepID=UPI003527AF0A